MDIIFGFQIEYKIVAVNEPTNTYKGFFEEENKRKAWDTISELKDYYKKSDGWKLSCERCIRLILGNKTKEWTSKLYHKPDFMTDYISKLPRFVLEPKFTLNPRLG